MKIKYRDNDRQPYCYWLDFWDQWHTSIEEIDKDFIRSCSGLSLVPMPNVFGCHQLMSYNQILITHIDSPIDEIEAQTALDALKDYIS